MEYEQRLNFAARAFKQTFFKYDVGVYVDPTTRYDEEGTTIMGMAYRRTSVPDFRFPSAADIMRDMRTWHHNRASRQRSNLKEQALAAGLTEDEHSQNLTNPDFTVLNVPIHPATNIDPVSRMKVNFTSGKYIETLPIKYRC